ncbi:peroxiredoxin [Granulosicoccus antarcticus]|uniref:thioredoxin-dependent peroxiredoxin n=1 Tax=Granulosicoccus antarcticus IMCC3135 TaxID=1192854 RepID=A0A2Z2NXS8_9GAMM|nr:peroxiredoxin [Granulosicoccus antarcticus]ASJ76073.1 Putative peroxiredoxin bcp [Granulosicoccus antarcticus IMCC3135]
MSIPDLDKPAPSFDLPATGGQNISLPSLKGSKVVLYFYPRDATPGCTTESQNFRDSIDAFTAAGVVILGLSQDTVASHEKFKTKQEMPFELLSDEDGSVCRAYDVIKLKKMYGKEFEGIERSTFLIDEAGVLRQQWRKVKVPGHVDEVLEAVQAL